MAAPRLVRVNARGAEPPSLDPEELASAEGVEVLAGEPRGRGRRADRAAYAGHQFGHFVPQLGYGYGRAIPLDVGTRHDIQLKDSGRTPYSRDGDGHAVLGVARAHRQRGHGGAGRAVAAVATGDSRDCLPRSGQSGPRSPRTGRRRMRYCEPPSVRAHLWACLAGKQRARASVVVVSAAQGRRGGLDHGGLGKRTAADRLATRDG